MSHTARGWPETAGLLPQRLRVVAVAQQAQCIVSLVRAGGVPQRVPHGQSPTGCPEATAHEHCHVLWAVGQETERKLHLLTERC